MVSLMETDKALKLTVALPVTPSPLPRLRKWVYKVDEEINYHFFESREVEFEEQDLFQWNETADALLNLVEPVRGLTAEEKEFWGEEEREFKATLLARDVTKPEKIADFLNRYGQIGLADDLRRARLSRSFTPDGGELTFQQFQSLCGLSYYRNSDLEAKRIKALKRKFNDRQYRMERVNRILWGMEIPFAWVEKDLFDLYKCVRIFLSLDKKYISSDSSYFSISLTRGKLLRRFLLASQLVALPEGKEEDYKPLSSLWNIPNKRIENAWTEFANNLNRFLSPISRKTVSTEEMLFKAREVVGLETWITYSFLESRAQYSEIPCQNYKCQKPTIRIRSTKRFCSEACQSTVRGRKHRAKNSSGKSQRKVKAKGKKKNG